MSSLSHGYPHTEMHTPHTNTRTYTHIRTGAQAQVDLVHISKPQIFSQVKTRLDRFRSANRPWLLAVGAGWWHVLREASSSSQYQPIQRQWAQDWSACLYVPLLCKLIGIRPTSAYYIQSFFFILEACASSESSRAVGNLPLTLSPVLPTLSAGKGLGKSGFVTLMNPLSTAAAHGGEKPSS